MKRYRFCGLPKGISMLPRFAAIVSRTTTGISRSAAPAAESRRIVSGTKEIRDTSFVTSMETKKQARISTVDRLRVMSWHSSSPTVRQSI